MAVAVAVDVAVLATNFDMSFGLLLAIGVVRLSPDHGLDFIPTLRQ